MTPDDLPEGFTLTQLEDAGLGYWRLTHQPCGDHVSFYNAEERRLRQYVGSHRCGGTYWEQPGPEPVVTDRAVQSSPAGYIVTGMGDRVDAASDAGVEAQLTEDVLTALGNAHARQPRVPARTLLILISFLEHELPGLDLDDFTLDDLERLGDLVTSVTASLGRTLSEGVERYKVRKAAFEALVPVLCSAVPGQSGGDPTT